MSENPGPSRNPGGQAHQLAGQPALWAPWRLAYLETMPEAGAGAGADLPAPASAPAPPQPVSFLAEYWEAPQLDAEHHVVYRDDRGMILLNKYPYANGHLLVALGEARPSLTDYDAAQREALWRLVDRAADLMQRALRPQGINIGINQGRAAGAGIPQHLHAHLVPRWAGDVNFITSIGNVRVIPGSLEAMAQRYRAVLSPR